jgi:NADP-dependent 3-hydroxy acid dehydrogenase YdfG
LVKQFICEKHHLKFYFCVVILNIKNKTRITRMQQDIKQLTVIIDDVDVSDPSQEKIASDKFIEEMKKNDYLPTDNYVALRDKKMSNIRGKRISTQEDVEIYAYSHVKRIGDKVQTVVVMKIV